MNKPRIQDYRFDIDERQCYRYDVPLHHLEGNINKHINEDKLNLDPDFQRGRVWTHEQQVAFAEFTLKGGKTNPIFFNHPGWFRSFEGEMVIVDGLQRLTSLMLFLEGKLPAFGYYRSDFADGFNIGNSISVCLAINSLPTREQVLRWYLQINSTGTPHTHEELDRVKYLLIKEQEKS